MSSVECEESPRTGILGPCLGEDLCSVRKSGNRVIYSAPGRLKDTEVNTIEVEHTASVPCVGFSDLLFVSFAIATAHPAIVARFAAKAIEKRPENSRRSFRKSKLEERSNDHVSHNSLQRYVHQ